MRYDTLVTFIHEGAGNVYNPDTGEYDEDKTSFTRLANVTDVGTSRSMELFGDLDTSNQVLRFANGVKLADWTYLTLPESDAHYVKVTTRKPLKSNTLIVGETHG